MKIKISENSADNLAFRVLDRQTGEIIDWTEENRQKILALLYSRSPRFDFMQWIGVVDDSKEEKKIFENDIVEVHCPNEFGSFSIEKGAVVFVPQKLGYDIIIPGSNPKQFTKIFVIGNTIKNKDVWESIKK